MKNLTRITKYLDKRECTLAEFKKLFGVDATSAVNSVYSALKDRQEHPCGTFDKGGRFYLTLSDLTYCRGPSRAYPYSEMNEGRTRKFVMRVWIQKDCKTLADLESLCFA